MRYTTLLFLFSFSLSFSLTSCSSGDDGDEPTNPTPTDPTERKLVIGVSANPWLDENGNARETRGAVITTQTLNKFSMHWNQDWDIYANYTVNRGNDGKWIPTPENSIQGDNWPAERSIPISFYAHTAGNYNYNGGNMYISFNSEEASGFQHDLLLSKITNVTYNGTGGVIWFTFDHACAAVEFNVQITNKLRTQLGTDLTVNSIELKNIAKTGDCYYSTGSGNQIGEWRNVGDSQGNETSGYTNYTLTQSEITVKTDLQSLTCNTMFVIPQKLREDSELEIRYTLPGKAKADTTKISLEDTEWNAGHLYPINIVLGTKLILGTTQTQNP